MASLRRQAKGDSWQLRVTLKGKRITISIPSIDEAQASEWQKQVQAIADSIEFDRPRERKTNEWLASLTQEQRKKLSDKGLIEPDEPEAQAITLAQYLEDYLGSRKADLKPQTWTFYQHTRKRLEEFFPGRELASITATDARVFRAWLRDSNKRDKPKDGEKPRPLSPNTIRRRTGLCRQIFRQAIEDGLIDRNPFAGLAATVRADKDRQQYVELETFAKVLDHAPNARWRSLLVLARLAAFRIPSEAQGLKWDHIAWDAKRISVIASSKTEHHETRQVRIVPMLPAVEKELLKLFAEAEEGAEYVFPKLRANSNLRTGLERIIARAGVKQWPKLWQNLRASGSTDFARSLPSHVAAAICGHTQQVAEEHYWQVSDSDLDSAIEALGPKLAQKLAHGEVSDGPQGSQADLDEEAGDSRKPLPSKEFDELCRLLAKAGFLPQVGDAGFEPVTSAV